MRDRANVRARHRGAALRTHRIGCHSLSQNVSETTATGGAESQAPRLGKHVHPTTSPSVGLGRCAYVRTERGKAVASERPPARVRSSLRYLGSIKVQTLKGVSQRAWGAADRGSEEAPEVALPGGRVVVDRPQGGAV